MNGAREGQEAALERWAALAMVQDAYPHFVPFCLQVMLDLGFDLTEIQEDIAEYIESGPDNLMVQAQRSQAKTTIAACYAVWSLIHHPSIRVLVVSAGGTQANEISTLIVRIITSMDVLSCMCPDKNAGDRTSVEAFDVHHSLKGLDKSPSVACVGITANLQGKRADLLIPDDVESMKNGLTPVQRAQLAHLTNDFPSICVGREGYPARTIWLGTPQTRDSIYNALPGRGVAVRIWPGRYPTDEQRPHYGDYLAPLILAKMTANPALKTGGGLLGNQGQPTDPVLLGEAKLQHKELNQGAAYFQLQHMLNTSLTDAMRHPLKTEHLMVLHLAPKQPTFPLTVVRGLLPSMLIPHRIHDFGFRTMQAVEISREMGKAATTWAYIDPAAGGENADETAWAIGAIVNSYVFLLSCGGMPGGYQLEKLVALSDHLAKFNLDGVTIEKNMGFGAFKEVLSPILKARIKCQIEDDLVVGQKELRIINTLAPLMGRGGLIIAESVIAEDEARSAIYAPSMRQTYSLFHQLAKITADRGALLHDDRADAVEGLVRRFQHTFEQDEEKAKKRLAEQAMEALKKNPLGYNYGHKGPPRIGRGTMLRHRR